jgi:hypothetical protein
MRLSFLFALFAWALISHAQTIDRAEYYIDWDWGAGNNTEIEVVDGNLVNLDIDTISVQGLNEDGLHRLYLRFHTHFIDDSGGVHDYWSMAEGRYFFVLPGLPSAEDSLEIVAVKYWYDDMEWDAHQIDLNDSSQVSFAAMISDSMLQADGMHTLAVSYQDDQGRWSMPERRYFWVMPYPVDSTYMVGAEYFFTLDINVDPGEGNGVSIISPDDDVWDESTEEVVTINTCQTSGQFFFCIRYIDNFGSWSAPECAQINVTTDSLPVLTINRSAQSILLSWSTCLTGSPFYVYKSFAAPLDTHLIAVTDSLFFEDTEVLEDYAYGVYFVRGTTGTSGPLAGRRGGMGKMPRAARIVSASSQDSTLPAFKEEQ